MGYWEEGMNEPVDQHGDRSKPITTGFPYQWDTEHVRHVDDETGAALPRVRIVELPSRRDDLAAFAALRDKPIEQKMDAVTGLYPGHVWDDDVSVFANWAMAVATEQNCGVGDVHDMVRDDPSPEMRSWLQMLKPRPQRRVSSSRVIG